MSYHEGAYGNLLLLSYDEARRRYYEGRITGDEWDAYCNAWDALNPVDGQYGHVSIGCDAARCSHRRIA